MRARRRAPPNVRGGCSRDRDACGGTEAGRSVPAVTRTKRGSGRAGPSGTAWWLIALAVVGVLACSKKTPPPREPSDDAVASPAKGPAPAAAAPDEPDAPGVTVLLRGARVMTAAGVDYPNGEVLIVDGRISAVGATVDAPADARVVDLPGKTLTPGIIDTHSHIGVYASPGFKAHADGNEAVTPVTAEVRAEDGYWPQDPQIERARAGGVTTMQILPGSANLIGGRSVVVKTYPQARRVDDARFAQAPPGLKMACGENPKRVYADKGGPSTRMGNLAHQRRAFQKAVEYRRKWDKYRDDLAKWRRGERRGSSSSSSSSSRSGRGAKKGDEDDGPPEAPERDFGLETLAKVIDGEILVHNHCYRADEMALMMRLAEEYGFRIRSFHHAVEAYKIADLLAAHGAGASVWADWWGFKAEAFDGIRENAAMISAAGARAIIHSDSAHGIQRLNQEASKAMHAGRRAGIDISDDAALRWITANPAWALGVQDHVGTIEAGKQADLAVWSGDPFSVYSKVERLYIEGEVVYDPSGSPTVSPHSDFETGFRTQTTPSRVASNRTPRPPASPRGPAPKLSFDGVSPAIRSGVAGCEIHTGDGTVIEDGAIVTRGARIDYVGPTAGAPDADSLARPQPRCVVTPGFVAASTAIGLVEIGMEEGTVDHSRQAPDLVRAAYDAATAVNADSSLIDVARIEGVTSAASTPRGGLLAGRVAWIDLVAGDHRHIVARPRVAMAGVLGDGVVYGSRAAALAKLEEVLADADFLRTRRAAFDRRQSRDLGAHRLDLEALAPVLDGSTPLVVEAHRASDILALLDLADRRGLRLTILGGTQAPRVAEALADAGVVVVVQPTSNLPGNLDRLGATMEAAALLHAAGVRVGIAVLGDSHNARNVRQEAGVAIANGLPREAAVTATSLAIAEAYGMQADYGSLQPGKVANYVVWTGDPFELSAFPQRVVVRGLTAPKDSRQTRLRERYRDLERFGDGGR